MVEFLLDLPVIGSEQLITDGLGISFMMQAWWNFCLCSGIYFFVSLLTPAPPLATVESLTWSSPWKVIFNGRLSGPGDPRLVAAYIVAGMAALYGIFH